MANYYNLDLAKIHNQGFAHHAIQSFDFLHELISKNHKSGLVVDLGCGSGITAEKFVNKGFDVYGIDYSKEMIKLAKERVPKAKFKAASFYDEAIPKCAAVLSIGECLNYNFDSKLSYNTLNKSFKKVYNSLTEKGIFIFDILEEHQISSGKIEKSFSEGNDWCVLVEKKENKKELERRIITLYKSGNSYKRNEEIHKIKLFDSDKLISMLRNIGFKVRKFRSYGDYKLRDNQAVIVATK